MESDLGNIIHRMQDRKRNGAKWSLKNELLQYRDAIEVKRRIPDEWKQFLHEQIGLKKSSLFSGIQIFREFGHLLIIPVDGAEGDEAFDVPCEYSPIPSSSLKLLLKVAKGADDAAKEEWLTEAAALSFSDLRKRIDELLGKEVHDCGPFEEVKAWKCKSCGKVRAQAVDGATG